MLQEANHQENNGSDSESSTVTASSSSTAAKKVPEQAPASMSLKSQFRNAPLPRRAPSMRSLKDELGSVSEHEAVTFQDSESTLGGFDESSIFGPDGDDISYETDDDDDSFTGSIESELSIPSRTAPLRRGVARNKSDELGFVSEHNTFGESENSPIKTSTNRRSINRGQLKRNKSDDLGSMSDHVLSAFAGKDVRPPRTGGNRRLTMTRNQSVCIRASHDDDNDEVSSEQAGNVDEDPRSEHITLVSLVNICNTPVDLNKSILKDGNDSSREEASNAKTLRFATNHVTGKIWTLAKAFDNSYLNDKEIDLWWSEKDLDKRIDQDSDLVGLVEDRLFDIMDKAFDSCSKHDEADKVELDLSGFAGCSLARGLEAEVFFEMKALRKRHRRSVLAAQSLVRGGSLRGSSEPVTVLTSSELELIRTQSRRISNSFRLVGMKIGESDALSAAKL